MVNEIGTLDYRPRTAITGPSTVGYPFFVPQIYHGYRRFKPLLADAVAVSIKDLLLQPDGRRVHDAFVLDPETRIIALGVAKDDKLEKWWGDRPAVIARLSGLHLDAVTVPNYSIFSNAPRYQTLVSIARIHRFAEDLSAAGIATVPHVYAETDLDWARWAEVLKEQPGISTLAMEFQTGLRVKERALLYFQRLAELQQRTGRPLHLLAVGGTRYRAELRTVFGDRFTLTDATSFMKTFRRIKADGPNGDEKVNMKPHEDLADLLQANIKAREKRLRRSKTVSVAVHSESVLRKAA